MSHKEGTQKLLWILYSTPIGFFVASSTTSQVAAIFCPTSWPVTVHVVDPTPWPLGSLTPSMTQSSTPPYSQDQSLILDHTNKHSPSITPTLSLPSSNHPLHSRTLMPTTQWPTIFLLTLIPLMPSLASLPLNPQLSNESPYHSELPASPASITQDPNFSSLLAVPETPWTCSHCRAIAVFSCFPPKNCPLTVPTVNWNCVVSIFHWGWECGRRGWLATRRGRDQGWLFWTSHLKAQKVLLDLEKGPWWGCRFGHHHESGTSAMVVEKPALGKGVAWKGTLKRMAISMAMAARPEEGNLGS